MLTVQDMLVLEAKFADIDPDTWNMSIDSTIKLIDKNTVAIVITHYAGLPADIHKLKYVKKMIFS